MSQEGFTVKHDGLPVSQGLPTVSRDGSPVNPGPTTVRPGSRKDAN